jgi:hydroxyacylglutathione hydrolase
MDKLHQHPDYLLYQIDVENRLANYNYVLHSRESGSTWVIDPTDADHVQEVLAQQQWNLHSILLTHHHADHQGGVEELKRATNCTVVGYARDAARLHHVDVWLEEGDHYGTPPMDTVLMDVSGHTIGHCAYYLPELGLLFSGDTLFSMGCGRIFEGTPEMMCASLARITALPQDTLICAAHEYTQQNGTFALRYEPNNAALQERMAEVRELRAQNMPTVPISLGTELATNPFLRVDSSEIRSMLGMMNASSVEVFAQLRILKNGA